MNWPSKTRTTPTHQRPKIEAHSKSLFIVLKTAHLQAGQVVYGETHLFVGAHFLVSVRHGASSSLAQVLQRCEDSTKDLPKGLGFALYAILDFVADNYQPVVAQFEQDFDAIQCSAKGYYGPLGAALRITSGLLHRLLHLCPSCYTKLLHQRAFGVAPSNRGTGSRN